MANIPNEILDYDILTRLPVKTLLRFKSVSKHCYTLINSPAFVKLLQKYGLANVMVSVGYYDDSPDNYLLCTYLDPSHFITTRDLDIGINTKGYYYRIVGSSNGLFCYLTSELTIVLCNPITRESRYLIDDFRISINTNAEYNYIDVRYGFGYDFAGRDYKIVKLLRYRTGVVLVKAYVQVYSLSIKAWDFGKVAPSSVLGCLYYGVNTNNKLHWTSSKVANNFNNLIIVTFDLHSEEFGEMAFLSIVEEYFNDRSSVELMECSGCLYTIENCGHRASIWVMKEYGVVESWTKICEMSPGEIFNGHEPIKVITYQSSLECGEVLLLSKYHVVWYNFECKIIQKVSLPEKRRYIDKPWVCSASLASIDSSLAKKG